MFVSSPSPGFQTLLLVALIELCLTLLLARVPLKAHALVPIEFAQFRLLDFFAYRVIGFLSGRARNAFEIIDSLLLCLSFLKRAHELCLENFVLLVPR